MNNGTISWNDTLQGKTIEGIENKIDEMRKAKANMLTAIDELRPNWKTEESIHTIGALESFLDHDFEVFATMVDDTKERLEKTRGITQEMDYTQ